MNRTQIHNMFVYVGIMIAENDLLTISPDYIKEKTLAFFGILGKPEFIKTPTIRRHFNFDTYCNYWKISNSDFELINVINFLNDINSLEKKEIFSNFRKYFGTTDYISSKDLSYLSHPTILKYINEKIEFDDRFCKLHELREKLGY